MLGCPLSLFSVALSRQLSRKINPLVSECLRPNAALQTSEALVRGLCCIRASNEDRAVQQHCTQWNAPDMFSVKVKDGRDKVIRGERLGPVSGCATLGSNIVTAFVVYPRSLNGIHQTGQTTSLHNLR
jgi:hypothetical protein